MLVHIDTNLFDKESYFRQIDHLFYFFDDGKHKLVIKDDNEVDVILDSKWLARLPKDIQQTSALFLEKAFEELVYTSSSELKNRNYFSVNEDNLSPNNAHRYLEQPLYIIVENKQNDSYFLNALIQKFRKKGKKLRQAKSENWLEYYNGGGKNTITQILPSFFENKDYLPRLFILVDSDKYYSTDTPQSSQALKDKCNELKVPFYILYKREMENYLPTIVFDNLSNAPESTIESYKHLNSEQKDFYDLEKGFEGNRSGLKKHNNLFDNLSNEDFNSLKSGFQLKKSLFKMFSDDVIDRVNLKERCKEQEHPQELETILEMITALL